MKLSSVLKDLGKVLSVVAAVAVGVKLLKALQGKKCPECDAVLNAVSAASAFCPACGIVVRV